MGNNYKSPDGKNIPLKDLATIFPSLSPDTLFFGVPGLLFKLPLNLSSLHYLSYIRFMYAETHRAFFWVACGVINHSIMACCVGVWT